MNYQHLFEQNYSVIKTNFPMSYHAMHACGALICAASGKILTEEQIKESKNLLKQQKNIFSAFRDHIFLIAVIRMALSDNPEVYLSNLSAIYERLHENFVFGSEEIVTAAITILENSKPGEHMITAENTIKIYNMTKKEHPMITGKKDLNFAVIMALSDINHSSIINETENCYDIIKKKFALHMEGIQSSSQILGLNSAPTEEKCKKLDEMYNSLKKNKLKIGYGQQLGLVALLVNTGLPEQQIIDTAKEYDKFLKKQKGLGVLTDSRARIMIAIALAIFELMADSDTISAAVYGSIISMIVDFEITMIVIISASAAAYSAN